MSKFNVFITICAITFGIAALATAQTYFEDNFDDAKASEDKWVPLFGEWEFADDQYHQLQNSVNCMSVVADDFWDDTWSEYTYEVRGSKVSGAEGFLIMFRCQGLMQPRGQALEDHPPRMENLKPSLEYWWNLGGWGNTRSQVESWGGKAGANSNHTIKDKDWYHIKIVNTPDSYTVILDDEEVAQVDDDTEGGVGRIGLATWATVAKYDDVIVYGPDGPSLPVDAKSKLATTWAHLKSVR